MTNSSDPDHDREDSTGEPSSDSDSIGQLLITPLELDSMSDDEILAYLELTDQPVADKNFAREGLDILKRVTASNAPSVPAQEELERFLGSSMAADLHWKPSTVWKVRPNKGDCIGDRYLLLEQIGEGGMGEVWSGEDLATSRQRVAIKLIKPGISSQLVLNRFASERQALAAMDHPNIARILDSGLSETNNPYFVMEYVRGLNLTDYCDSQRLGIRERLELFTQIAQGVQHAHQKGLIHRDLKPSNILVSDVDGHPVPKIIDFGLAKAIGSEVVDASMTQFGTIVGTLEYMSPEQAGKSNLDIDTRADIYSLGVILYELLTGMRPFGEQHMQQVALDEVVRMIKEVDEKEL